MFPTYCLEGANAFLERCFTKNFNIPCVELGGMRPSLKHNFVNAEKQYITLFEFNEEFATMDT
jgi:hypothetical protein